MCAKLMLKLNLNVQDDSGYICSKELGSLLRTLGYNPTESEVFKLMAEVDVDHNGKVGVLLVDTQYLFDSYTSR